MGKTKPPKGKKPKRPKPKNGKAGPILTAAAELGVEILTLDEAASLLRVSADALKADAEKEKVPARLIGGEWRFMKHSLVNWLMYPEIPRVSMSDLKPVSSERILKSMPTARRKLTDMPFPEIPPEEYEAFRAALDASRDEVDRMTKSGKYAEDE